MVNVEGKCASDSSNAGRKVCLVTSNNIPYLTVASYFVRYFNSVDNEHFWLVEQMNPTSHHQKEGPSSNSGHLVKVTTRNGPTISKTSLNTYSQPLLNKDPLLSSDHYGSHSSSSSSRHLSSSYRNGISRSAFFSSELPHLDPTKAAFKLNLNQGSSASTPGTPMVDTLPTINNNLHKDHEVTNNNKKAGWFPLTHTEALSLYGNRLTEYEKTEIDNYSKIWYLGLNAHKINGDNWGSQNGGYDDDSGNYNKLRADKRSLGGALIAQCFKQL
ncbi:hypothetical protein HUJ05_003511 [Dendroctonus ponderosae]|nr:hypothetical protein HUJ05_003511 [Dendroctonus ponderosae]